MDYSDLIQEIVNTGREWLRAKRLLDSLGESRKIWETTEYQARRSEVLRLHRVGRQTYKDIVQRWLGERGIEAKVRSEADFRPPGVDYRGSWAHPTLPLCMLLGSTSIHNDKHAVQTKYKWLNKITVCGTRVISQCARTDETFTWATAEAFAAFTVEVRAALDEAFKGNL